MITKPVRTIMCAQPGEKCEFESLCGLLERAFTFILCRELNRIAKVKT